MSNITDFQTNMSRKISPESISANVMRNLRLYTKSHMRYSCHMSSWELLSRQSGVNAFHQLSRNNEICDNYTPGSSADVLGFIF